MKSLNENQIQVILTGIFGDGSIPKVRSKNGVNYKTNCIHKEYIRYKQDLLGTLPSTTRLQEKNGYAQKPIYHLQTKIHPEIQLIKENTLNTNLSLLTDLGIALWFYDDGSIHKRGLFYNLNTHAFSRDVQERLFIPFFNKLGIFPSLAYDKKQDGRIFTYLRVNIHDGAYEVNQILRKYPVDCYKYKLWPEDYFQKYDKYKSLGLCKEDIKTQIKKDTSTKMWIDRKSKL